MLGKPLELKCLSLVHFKYDKENKWHKTSKEKAGVEQVLMLKGPGLDSEIDKVLQKMVEMIKTLAHQTNKHYLDLSKRLKKMKERVIKGTEEVTSKELQPVKDQVRNLHKDVKNVRILVKNVEMSLAKSDDTYTDTDEEDKFSDERAPDVTISDKPPKLYSEFLWITSLT